VTEERRWQRPRRRQWLRALVFSKNRGHRIISFEEAGNRIAEGLTASGRPAPISPPRPREEIAGTEEAARRQTR
jgi:hypothetical protein